MCFYEPFHEGIQNLTQKKIAAIDHEHARKLGHHGLNRPYFAEYAPLVSKRRGIKGFPARLSYDEFFGLSQNGAELAFSYFEKLSALAASHEKIPVFCFNRSWGRIHSIKKLMPHAVHVFSLREPSATLASFQTRRTYFFAKLLMIFSKSHPEMIAEFFPEVANLSLLARLRLNKTFKSAVSQISDERFTSLFWSSYAIGMKNGLIHSDFVIDLGHSDPHLDDRLRLVDHLAPSHGASGTTSDRPEHSILSQSFLNLAKHASLKITRSLPEFSTSQPPQTLWEEFCLPANDFTQSLVGTLGIDLTCLSTGNRYFFRQLTREWDQRRAHVQGASNLREKWLERTGQVR